MATLVRIWLEAAHHQTFRIGGWAVLRLTAGDLRGTAGGARRVDQERATLLAFAAALADLPAGAAVDLRTSSSEVLAIPGRLAAAEAGEAVPDGDLDAWAQAATALRRIRVVLAQADLAPGGPSAFAAAWAAFALDRAKTRGDFAAVIPKSNLAKAGV